MKKTVVSFWVAFVQDSPGLGAKQTFSYPMPKGCYKVEYYLNFATIGIINDQARNYSFIVDNVFVIQPDNIDLLVALDLGFGNPFQKVYSGILYDTEDKEIPLSQSSIRVLSDGVAGVYGLGFNLTFAFHSYTDC